MKLNHSGFALVETLIVSVFVLGIFTMLYTNYYPMIGEYEKRENYDSIESVYRTEVVKNYIQESIQPNEEFAGIQYQLANDNSILIYNNAESLCNKSESEDFKFKCNSMWKALKINLIILTKYNITSAKNTIKNASNISNGMKEYVNSLPNYTTNKYGYNGRVIVEYKEVIDIESSKIKTNVYKYSTLGVDL